MVLPAPAGSETADTGAGKPAQTASVRALVLVRTTAAVETENTAFGIGTQ